MRKLNKRQTFVAVLGACVILPLLYQSIWIFSRTATAEIYAADAARSRGGFLNRGIRISMEFANYEVGTAIYHGSYFRDEHDLATHTVHIRYLSFAPGISRKNNFVGNRVYTLIFIGFFLFVTSVEGEQALKRRLETQADLFENTEVSTSVYKFNPNAIAIFIGYLVLFFWFFKILLTGMYVGPGIIFLGAVLVFVPLFVQNTNNPTFKAKIPDQGSLIFSTDGVHYKEVFYSIDDIEAAVVYLEAFRGFEYKERTTLGSATTISSGDNNKISCRCKGEIIDFTFILDYFSDYWSFKTPMAHWSVRGVNVILEKVFEDDFVVQEMVKFHTPVSAEHS